MHSHSTTSQKNNEYYFCNTLSNENLLSTKFWQPEKQLQHLQNSKQPHKQQSKLFVHAASNVLGCNDDVDEIHSTFSKIFHRDQTVDNNINVSNNNIINSSICNNNISSINNNSRSHVFNNCNVNQFNNSNHVCNNNDFKISNENETPVKKQNDILPSDLYVTLKLNDRNRQHTPAVPLKLIKPSHSNSNFNSLQPLLTNITQQQCQTDGPSQHFKNSERTSRDNRKRCTTTTLLLNTNLYACNTIQHPIRKKTRQNKNVAFQDNTFQQKYNSSAGNIMCCQSENNIPANVSFYDDQMTSSTLKIHAPADDCYAKDLNSIDDSLNCNISNNRNISNNFNNNCNNYKNVETKTIMNNIGNVHQPDMGAFKNNIAETGMAYYNDHTTTSSVANVDFCTKTITDTLTQPDSNSLSNSCTTNTNNINFIDSTVAANNLVLDHKYVDSPININDTSHKKTNSSSDTNHNNDNDDKSHSHSACTSSTRKQQNRRYSIKKTNTKHLQAPTKHIPTDETIEHFSHFVDLNLTEVS
ncbi:hypothetical protein HELRODRAFT_170238 [Helobdella robusta]|uniref:Uncharacterized protein n=1 Tax=Helobdella robusta TaxID=6412 RepID=T1F2T4_HELRO|nr:hypothetical protein HELRODRAFT_170238 [Helobdella robusta]ESO07700.1 hypothetical protein HELRODRAFT_170238 [Helobdella robusta]